MKLFGHGKLWSKWMGTYLVIDTLVHGAVMIQDDEGTIHKVNGHRLKLFLDHDTTMNEDIDVIELVHHDYIFD
jgi:hypothetical protein